MGKQDLIIKQQAALSSDPAAPPAGYMIIYPKTDGKWYSIDSSSTITEVTNSGSLADADFLLVNTFRSLYQY